jgi:hypothetical protein
VVRLLHGVTTTMTNAYVTYMRVEWGPPRAAVMLSKRAS